MGLAASACSREKRGLPAVVADVHHWSQAQEFWLLMTSAW